MSEKSSHSKWRLHPKSKKLCSCCEKVATHKIEIRTSWFRGDDEVYLVCPDHEAMTAQQKWDDFYYDRAITASRRAA